MGMLGAAGVGASAADAGRARLRASDAAAGLAR